MGSVKLLVTKNDFDQYRLFSFPIAFLHIAKKGSADVYLYCLLYREKQDYTKGH